MKKAIKNTWFSFFLVFFTTIALLIIQIVVLFVTFRELRLFFPPAKITDAKVIGFSHYFGYPFYFDTIIFFLLFLSPVIFVGFQKFIDNKRKK